MWDLIAPISTKSGKFDHHEIDSDFSVFQKYTWKTYRQHIIL